MKGEWPLTSESKSVPYLLARGLLSSLVGLGSLGIQREPGIVDPNLLKMWEECRALVWVLPHRGRRLPARQRRRQNPLPLTNSGR